jgi:acyl carrier protein
MVIEKIKALIAEQFDVDEDTISSDTSFEEFGADSVDIAELVTALEEEFDIEIPEEYTDAILTVGDVVSAVKKNMPKA